MSKFLALACLGGLTIFACAGAQTPTELQPQTATFPGKTITLQQALATLQKQTGNVVSDRRTDVSNPSVNIPFKNAGFWPVLDAISKETKIGVSTRQPDGGVALVNSPYRERKTHYSGIFRFSLKGISVTRDDETQTHLCNVTFDTAWEPRFKALFINLENASVAFGKESRRIEREAAMSVSGTGATEIALGMKAPERAVAKIDSLKGTIRVIGIPKMLDFAIPGLTKDKFFEQEGVKVKLTRHSQSRERRTVELLVVYPEGAITPLESFQGWRDNNRVWLTWIDPKTKKTQELDASSVGGAEETEAGTRMQFHFTTRAGQPLPAPNVEVALRYRTPNRVVAFTVPFEFRDLPLP